MEQAERRRQAAQRLLAAMTDDELRAVLVAQRASTWRLPKLVEHHRAHRDEWPRYFSLPEPTMEEYAEIAPSIVLSWDRVFLAIEPGGPTWVFVRDIGDTDCGIVVATRRGRIRTTMVASQLGRWLQRQLEKHGGVEVTARARESTHLD